MGKVYIFGLNASPRLTAINHGNLRENGRRIYTYIFERSWASKPFVHQILDAHDIKIDTGMVRLSVIPTKQIKRFSP